MVSFWGCAPVLKGAPERESLHAVTEISGGLPTEGLWREGVALIDMDGDGFLDIIAPPPRKGGEGRNRPYIFMRGKDGTWREGKYDFPEVKYGYGGIAAGDLNGDGYPDIVIAVHSGEIILLVVLFHQPSRRRRNSIRGPWSWLTSMVTDGLT